ncbi:hypothetical protein L7F22_032476 [Adiantum nelumboides]|nr:hypothetical protein [Adiantum nelumboides]
MMSNIDNSSSTALSSVLEVAAFAGSLLELLLTRVLPLLGFLTAHFLLHCLRLLASVVAPPAAADRPLTTLHLRNEQQQQQQLFFRADDEQEQQHQLFFRADDEQQDQSYGDLKPLKITTSSPSVEEIFKVSELQEQPQQSATPPAIAASPAAHDLLPQAPHLKPSDAEPTSDLPPSNSEGQSSIAAAAPEPVQSSIPAAAPGSVHVALSAPSDAEAPIQEQPLDLTKNEETASPLVKSETNVDAFQSSVDGNSVNGQHVEESGSFKTFANESIKRHPFTRVLPPSLSHIKRTLMRRSSRGFSSKKPSPRVQKLVHPLRPMTIWARSFETRSP